MVGATDLLESNEDMTFSSSILSAELTKKETLDQKSFYVKIKLSLVFFINWGETVVEKIWDCHWTGNASTINT